MKEPSPPSGQEEDCEKPSSCPDGSFQEKAPTSGAAQAEAEIAMRAQRVERRRSVFMVPLAERDHAAGDELGDFEFLVGADIQVGTQEGLPAPYEVVGEDRELSEPG